MNPKPLASLNHFTVPLVRIAPLPSRVVHGSISCRRGLRAGSRGAATMGTAVPGVKIGKPEVRKPAGIAAVPVP
jgi:hypothetical protein